jgi:adenylate kinase family enzyme|tara:strand:+ start:356 stop:1195 length:840 start_codon:yes stop_codon:yes gene_type:complete
MIKLENLLREVTNAAGVNAGATGGLNNPKAIILAGAPGAGKGYVLKGLNISNLQVLNVDNAYIQKLKDANVSLDLKNATPDERSKQAIAMADANKEFKGSVQKTIEAKQSFILDGTAGSYKQTAALKEELIKAGYEVFMLYVYTDLQRSLIQNQDRFERSSGEDRSLAPAIVLRTWNSVTQNYNPYRELFGDNFVSVANTLKDEKLTNLDDITDKYLKPYAAKNTKPKTAARQRYADKQKEKTTKEINALLSDDGVRDIIDNSISKEEAQIEIGKFLNK